MGCFPRISPWGSSSLPPTIMKSHCFALSKTRACLGEHGPICNCSFAMCLTSLIKPPKTNWLCQRHYCNDSIEYKRIDTITRRRGLMWCHCQIDSCCVSSFCGELHLWFWFESVNVFILSSSFKVRLGRAVTICHCLVLLHSRLTSFSICT